MKIAIIGNSHLAALKFAVKDGLFCAKELDVTFWGVAGKGFAETSYEGGHFRTPYRDFVLKVSDGQHENLPAQAFDAIVFHGLPLNVWLYLSALRKASDDLRCYSRASLRDGLQMHLKGDPTYRLVEALRADYDRPVLISPLALKSEDSGELALHSITSDELNFLNSCISAILSDMQVEYVAQPLDTIRDYKYTKREFCLNSVRLAADLSIKHADDDYDHMNGQYGARVLREIVTRLAAR
jgi:hypothetical protein